MLLDTHSTRYKKVSGVCSGLFVLTDFVVAGVDYTSYCKIGFIGADIILGQHTICIFGIDFILGFILCVILSLL